MNSDSGPFAFQLLEAAKKVVITPEEKEQQRPIRLLRSAQSLRAGSIRLLPFGLSPSAPLGASAKQGRL